MERTKKDCKLNSDERRYQCRDADMGGGSKRDTHSKGRATSNSAKFRNLDDTIIESCQAHIFLLQEQNGPVKNLTWTCSD